MKENKLKEIIEFGIERGWKANIVGDFTEARMDQVTGEYLAWFKFQELPEYSLSAVLFLFSHPFAKAVFGEEDHDAQWDDDGGTLPCLNCKKDAGYGADYCWQHHLQQAVISDSPIDYYFEYINEKKEN